MRCSLHWNSSSPTSSPFTASVESPFDPTLLDVLLRQTPLTSETTADPPSNTATYNWSPMPTAFEPDGTASVFCVQQLRAPASAHNVDDDDEDDEEECENQPPEVNWNDTRRPVHCALVAPGFTRVQQSQREHKLLPQVNNTADLVVLAALLESDATSSSRESGGSASARFEYRVDLSSTLRDVLRDAEHSKCLNASANESKLLLHVTPFTCSSAAESALCEVCAMY